MSNIDIDNKDIEVIDNIDLLVENYIATLNNQTDIYKKQCFTGLIKNISRNIKHNVDYDNLEQLQEIWDIYTELCYKFNNIVTIERFCILINISRETFYSWMNGKTRRQYSQKLDLTRSDMLKKWSAESESSLQDEASTGNPGAMFILKARNNWRETAPAPITVQQVQANKTIDQIREEMEAIGIETIQDN